MGWWRWALNLGRKLAEGRPDEVVHNPDVVEAYLGVPDIVDKLTRTD